jgi:hypothetical protein
MAALPRGHGLETAASAPLFLAASFAWRLPEN